MKNQATSGFTLIEILITMTLAAILLGVAVPNFSSYLRNSRLTAVANDVIAAMHAARSEAIKRQLPVVFCFSASPRTTTPACDGDGSQGWIVFADADKGGTVTTGDTILLRHDALPTGVGIHNSLNSGNKGYVSFQSSGFAATVIAVGEPISSFLLCDSRGNATSGGTDISSARGIEINALGRSSVTRSVTSINNLGNCS